MPTALQKPNRVMVTGVSGPLGHHILLQLGKTPGTGVLALHRPESKLTPLEGIRYAAVDFFDQDQLAAVAEKFAPDAIVHCAAAGTSLPKLQWFDLVRFNIEASLNLCEIAARNGPCRFVYVSTALAYRPKDAPLVETDPLDTLHPYGASKAAAESIIRSAAHEFGAPLTIVRPFSFTGVGDNRSRLFPSLLRAAGTGEPMALTSGLQVRDHCSARDMARGILATLDRPAHRGEADIYNLGSGETVRLRDLLEDLVAELGLRVTLNFGARPHNPVEPMFLVADATRAHRELGWKPVHHLAHAVWQLSRASFPELKLSEPRELI
jgi:nucleoside-diphosphate-sugar epimerase